MSKFLLFECDPIDQPAATDPVERSTWCALRIQVGQRSASRVWDRMLQTERTSLYVPAFPIAEWLVQNWWSLLNELISWDAVPKSAISEQQLSWIKRHCLRSADSSLMLPALYLFHDGRNLRAEWQADAPDSVPNMPGEFTSDGEEQLDSNITQDFLAQFINDILDRVRQTGAERVKQLAAHWRAIQGADAEEQNFCILAGRMGIDPYDESQMTEKLAEFLEQSITDPDNPLVRDLTEMARPESVMEQWAWLTNISQTLQLGPNKFEPTFGFPSQALSPPHFGYQLARKVRVATNTDVMQPLESVEKIASSVIGKHFRTENQNHVPGHGIRAIVGGTSSGDIIAAGPESLRRDNQRFLVARSVYHALVTIQDSQRLVTDANSWNQKASRAFAAELLAPQQALASRISTTVADGEHVEQLSQEFEVSTIVVEKQLENAGIPLSWD